MTTLLLAIILYGFSTQPTVQPEVYTKGDFCYIEFPKEFYASSNSTIFELELPYSPIEDDAIAMVCLDNGSPLTAYIKIKKGSKRAAIIKLPFEEHWTVSGVKGIAGKSIIKYKIK